VHGDFEKCTQIFLHQDIMRRVLEPPYSRPYQLLSRREKTLQILVHGRPITMSTVRVKPAYMLNEPDHRTTTTFNPAAEATLATAPDDAPPPPIAQTTRSRHYVYYPTHFNI
jgi:hypothetical protein